MNTKVCLIGCGYWGKNLLRVLNNLGVLSGAFDINEKIVDKYSKDKLYKDVYFGTDWEVVLGNKDMSGVFIASPPNMHYEMAKKCLNANKNIFVEKPFTTNVKEAEELLTIANNKNIKIFVGHIFLYSPEIIKLKEIVSSEDFGDIWHIDTNRQNLGQIQSPANVIEDLLPHDISLIDYLLGKKCDNISAVGFRHVLGNVEDVAFINMKYGNVSIHSNLSWIYPLKVRDTIVVGSKQMAVADSINKSVTVYNKSVDLQAMEEGMSINYARHLLSYKYGDTYSPYIQPFEPLTKECQEFISCIEENRQPLSGGELGLGVVKTLVAAKESLKNNGAWVKV